MGDCLAGECDPRREAEERAGDQKGHAAQVGEPAPGDPEHAEATAPHEAPPAQGFRGVAREPGEPPMRARAPAPGARPACLRGAGSGGCAAAPRYRPEAAGDACHPTPRAPGRHLQVRHGELRDGLAPVQRYVGSDQPWLRASAHSPPRCSPVEPHQGGEGGDCAPDAPAGGPAGRRRPSARLARAADRGGDRLPADAAPDSRDAEARPGEAGSGPSRVGGELARGGADAEGV